MFVDASRELKDGARQNRLHRKDIEKIVATVSSTLPAALNGLPVSMEIKKAGLESAIKETITKSFYVDDFPGRGEKPLIGVLTMSAVTASQFRLHD